jgi:VanZ family protein
VALTPPIQVPTPLQTPLPRSENDWTLWRNRAALAVLVGYWLTLFFMTHTSQLERFFPFSLWDKFEHFSAYAGLAFLISLNWSLRQAMGRRQWLTIIGLIAAFGVFDELSQIPVGRNCDALDWVADMLGSLSGIGLFRGAVALYRRPARLRPN